MLFFASFEIDFTVIALTVFFQYNSIFAIFFLKLLFDDCGLTAIVIILASFAIRFDRDPGMADSDIISVGFRFVLADSLQFF